MQKDNSVFVLYSQQMGVHLGMAELSHPVFPGVSVQHPAFSREREMIVEVAKTFDNYEEADEAANEIKRVTSSAYSDLKPVAVPSGHWKDLYTHGLYVGSMPYSLKLKKPMYQN